jgi:hypothetical protein
VPVDPRQIPHARLEDETELSQDPIDGLVAAVIADLHAASFPHR